MRNEVYSVGDFVALRHRLGGGDRAQGQLRLGVVRFFMLLER